MCILHEKKYFDNWFMGYFCYKKKLTKKRGTYLNVNREEKYRGIGEMHIYSCHT